MEMHGMKPRMDGGILPWTTQGETLNQLVEGSSPSRLTGNDRATKKESRAKWRGSLFPREIAATESVQKYVER